MAAKMGTYTLSLLTALSRNQHISELNFKFVQHV